MISRAAALWSRLRDSLWFLPFTLTVAGAVLATVVTGAESRGFALAGLGARWVYGGGVEGARGVLSAIAGSLITVTGVVFSVTIVALQLASSQYTPRLLRDFTADRGNQLVLGVFIGTFTYTLLVLRTVRSAMEDGAAFVPSIAVTIAIVLAIVSIGFLIYFVDHSARSIQVSTILDRVTRRTIADIEKLFPANIGEPSPSFHAVPAGTPHIIEATRSGYVQQVDGKSLFDAGEAGSMFIEMEVSIGSFVMAGTALASVRGAALPDSASRRIRSAFVIGSQRTPGQDVGFGLVEISDIAVKAVSPGINDPTTALHCIDRIGELLAFLGSRSEPPPTRSRTGQIHFLARGASFEQLATRAIEPIAHFSRDIPIVVFALLSMLGVVRDRVAPRHRLVVTALANQIGAMARRRFDSEDDRQKLDAIIRGMELRSPPTPHGE